MAVLDTTFLVAVEKGQSDAEERYRELADRREALRVPGAVWTEYLSGFSPTERDRARDLLEATLAFEPFTRRMADEAARVQHELMRSGDPLGWHDLQVATTALHYDEMLVSSDKRFAAVPGLAWERP